MNERSVGNLPSQTWFDAHAAFRFSSRSNLFGSVLWRSGSMPRHELMRDRAAGDSGYASHGCAPLRLPTAYSMQTYFGSR